MCYVKKYYSFKSISGMNVMEIEIDEMKCIIKSINGIQPMSKQISCVSSCFATEYIERYFAISDCKTYIVDLKIVNDIRFGMHCEIVGIYEKLIMETKSA